MFAVEHSTAARMITTFAAFACFRMVPDSDSQKLPMLTGLVVGVDYWITMGNHWYMLVYIQVRRKSIAWGASAFSRMEMEVLDTASK